MLNRAEVIGHLGKDPETRYSAAGVAVTSFSVAATEKWKGKDGQQNERTEWLNITTFNRLAEICGEYLRKGSLVFVAGKIQTDKYEKDGVTRYSTKIIANEMKMLGGRGDSERAPQQQGGPTLPADDLDSDIPFAQHERGWIA